MDARALTLALKGRWGGLSGMARCPAHDDKRPSLSITDGHDGKVLIRCHGGCAQTDVITALTRLKLWPTGNGKDDDPVPWTPPDRRLKPPPIPAAPETAPDFRKLLGRVPSHVWDYRSIDGQLLGFVARIDELGRGKKILPITPDGRGGWTTRAFPEPRPLYGLPALAERPEAPVLIVEGEKAACAAGALLDEHVVVTWPGGCEAVSRADWRPLEGRCVTVWPDNDESGLKAAEEVARLALAAGAAEARIVQLPFGLPKGWDLADEMPPGLDPASLIAAAVPAQEIALRRLDLVSAPELLARPFREPRWAVPGILPEGCAILGGRPKSGKSWWALDVAVAVAAGGLALGSIRCEAGPVLYIGLEDPLRRLQGRLRAVLQGAPAPAMLTLATVWRLADAGGLDDLRLWLQANPAARLIVIDTLQRFRGRADRNEGVYANDYATIAPIKALADEFNIVILLVHHQRKEATADPLDSISGTAGLTGAVDSVLVLKREQGSPYGVLYVRGRDVAETEEALSFDAETGKWSRLGAANDWRRSQERNAIVRTLLDAGSPLRPAEVADALKRPRGAVRWLMLKMAKGNEITQLGNGTYVAPTP